MPGEAEVASDEWSGGAIPGNIGKANWRTSRDEAH
jgi:hypothetical protein